jgi:hypothetical protein
MMEKEEELAQETSTLEDTRRVVQTTNKEVERLKARVKELEAAAAKKGSRKTLLVPGQEQISGLQTTVQELTGKVTQLELDVDRLTLERDRALAERTRVENDLRHAEALRMQAEDARRAYAELTAQAGPSGEVVTSSILLLKERDVSIAELKAEANKTQLELVRCTERIKTTEARLEASEGVAMGLRKILGSESADRQTTIDQLMSNIAAAETERASRLQQEADQAVAIEHYRATAESHGHRLAAANRLYEHMRKVYEDGIAAARGQQLRLLQSVQANGQLMDAQRAAEAEAHLATSRLQMASWVDLQAQAASLMEWSQQNTTQTNWVMQMAQTLKELHTEARSLEYRLIPWFIKHKIDPWIMQCWERFKSVQDTNKEAASFLIGMVNKAIEDRNTTALHARITSGEEEPVETLYVHPDGTVSHERTYVQSAPLEAPTKQPGTEMVVWGANFQ